ncbi:MAG TPA: hypothetical protein PL009_09180 [Flavipsychrobacter sp.]|nr:hypothetical protein [Flavipsychrobacter sp.]
MKIAKLIFSILIVSLCYILPGCNPSSNNNVTPYGPDSISAYLACEALTQDSTIWQPGIYVEQAYAYFKQNPSDSNTFLVDSVLINGKMLLVDGSNIGYFITDSTLELSNSSNWRVAGNTLMPSFSYNHALPMPAITGILPDTVHLNSGITFTLSFQNADSVIISFPDSTGNVVSKTFSESSTAQYFSSGEIAALRFYSVYDVTAFASTTVTLSGKKIIFTKVRRIRHVAWVM